MMTSPAKSPNSATATRDAMFLFDLFRESPTPILIQIGPYAAKTGAKPNTIIKRLAGIKARNGLNISTTLGNYKRPSEQSEGQNGVADQPEVKRGQKRGSEALKSIAEAQPKNDERFQWRDISEDQGLRTESGFSTATPYSSLSSPSFPGQFSPPQWRMQAYEQTTQIPTSEISKPFHVPQEIQEGPQKTPCEDDIDGVAVKRIKTDD